MIKEVHGSTRFCIDYRYLNKVMENDYHLIFFIEPISDKLWSAKYTSKIDLNESTSFLNSKKYTAFSIQVLGFCQFCHYRHMHFRLTNAPTTFQRFINASFGLSGGQASLERVCSAAWLLASPIPRLLFRDS